MHQKKKRKKIRPDYYPASRGKPPSRDVYKKRWRKGGDNEEKVVETQKRVSSDKIDALKRLID